MIPLIRRRRIVSLLTIGAFAIAGGGGAHAQTTPPAPAPDSVRRPAPPLPDPSLAPAKAYVVGLSAVGVFNKVRIKVEHRLSGRVSVGVTVAGYYGLYPGFQVAPFARRYFDSNALEGFYAQGHVAIAVHRQIYSPFINRERGYFVTGGVGLGVGRQWLLGPKKRFSIDLMAGLKWYPYPTNTAKDFYPDFWYFTGPGSVFNGLVSLGHAF